MREGPMFERRMNLFKSVIRPILHSLIHQLTPPICTDTLRPQKALPAWSVFGPRLSISLLHTQYAV